jgi:hypothetical protein
MVCSGCSLPRCYTMKASLHLTDNLCESLSIESFGFLLLLILHVSKNFGIKERNSEAYWRPQIDILRLRFSYFNKCPGLGLSAYLAYYYPKKPSNRLKYTTWSGTPLLIQPTDGVLQGSIPVPVFKNSDSFIKWVWFPTHQNGKSPVSFIHYLDATPRLMDKKINVEKQIWYKNI